jgi:GTP-dependent dephospho-CoA kinase
VLILKKEGRSKFKKPFGTLYPSIKDLKKKLRVMGINSLIISVGDLTTINLQKEGIIPQMGILDNKIERKASAYENEIVYDKVTLKAQNPPGTITEDLWDTIEEGFRLIKTAGYNVLIVVDGEEDLAVIPGVITAPPGSVVIYGQPGEGVVLCEVDQLKNKAKKLMETFEEV